MPYYIQKGKNWNLSTCDWECYKACKIGKYLFIKYCLHEKRFFDNLVLTYEDIISNATEITIDNKISDLRNFLSYSRYVIGNYMLVYY